jgi:hypothetical protein
MNSPRIRRLRFPLAIIGSVAFVIGLLALIAPPIVRAIPIAAIIAILGNDYVLVASLSGTAIFIVLAVLVARGVTGINQTAPPDPEEIHNVPCFGEEFDEFVSGGGLRAFVGSEHHQEVRSRLRNAALATVMRESNCTRSEAIERIENGTWTNDTDAAAFLAGAGEPGLTARVMAALRGESPVQEAARRTATEIVRYDSEADQ